MTAHSHLYFSGSLRLTLPVQLCVKKEKEERRKERKEEKKERKKQRKEGRKIQRTWDQALCLILFCFVFLSPSHAGETHSLTEHILAVY